MAKILVSDDDPQILRLVSLCLRPGGHDVVMTSDPTEVAPLARESAFDVIVLDVMMVPISGFDVMSELRSDPETAGIPILLLSGRAEGSDRVRGLKEGANDYLTKPFEPEELALRVELLAEMGRIKDEKAPSADGYMGRYEVQGVIGQGTMGTVYRGWDPRLRRSVALKTIRLDQTLESQRQGMLERLHNEAVTVARFNHPNIVGVYDMGDTEDSAFLAMELVDGVSLAAYLAAVERVAAAKLIPLGLGMAQGLEAAHERQVIHRDVKPGNVLLGRDGGIKVTDFGVAYIFSRKSEEATQVYGTPGYVPPESLRQEPYTPAGDLFGLGAILYEAAAGVHPLAGANLREIIDNTLRGKIIPLAERHGDLPEDLTRLVMELLAPSPDDRPSAAAVVEILAAVATRDQLRWRAADLPSDL